MRATALFFLPGLTIMPPSSSIRHARAPSGRIPHQQSRTLRFVFVALFLAGLASFYLAAATQAQEDTAHLVLRKKGPVKDSPSVYIVQKGDNLSTIIRRKLGKPASESASVSRLVRKLNPQIRDVNRIYPGQKIALPRLASEPGKTGYVVRKGDSLSAILHERLGIPPV